MKPQKSSKKFNLIVVVLVLLIGISIGGYLVLESKVVSTQEGNIQTGNNAQETALAMNEDSDQDGLEDWQEILFGTDKNNPDTDGDGYLDGEEILSHHDPLKPAPNDKVIEGTITEKDNLTQYFANQLAKQMNGLNPSPDEESLLKISAQDILNNISSEELSELKRIGLIFIPDPPQEDNLEIIQTTKQNVLDYLKGIQVSLSKDKDVCEDLETFTQALETSDFSKINQIAAAYGLHYQDIKNLAVPDEFSSLHLELLNILSLTKTSLENFAQLNEDPVKGYLGLEMYRQAYSLLPGFTEKLIDQLALVYKE